MEIKELDKQISSGKIGRLYFFYGEEQFILENKIKAIKSKLIDKEFEEFNYEKLNSKKITADDIESALLSVPVMSDKRMVVVNDSNIFGNAKTKDFTKICEALSDLPDYLTVIFTEKEFDKKKEKNLDVFRKHGEIVKFDRLSPKQIELWLEKNFEENGKTVLASDLSRMVALCGHSMSNVYNEYQKLLNFAGKRTKITAEDIESVVSKSVEARIFDIIDNIAEGRTKTVFEELNALIRSSDDNSSSALTLLATSMGELLMVKQLTDERVPVDKIAEYFEPRKHPFILKKMTEQSRRFRLSYLRQMAQKGVDYTVQVRSGLLDKRIAIEIYVSELVKK